MKRECGIEIPSKCGYLARQGRVEPMRSVFIAFQATDAVIFLAGGDGCCVSVYASTTM